MAYSGAVWLLYTHHKKQDKSYILVAGLTIATAVSCATLQPLQTVVLTILPVTALVCLVLSSCAHGNAVNWLKTSKKDTNSNNSRATEFNDKSADAGE